MQSFYALLLVICIFLPHEARAEVIDKIVPLEEIWLWCVGGTSIGFAATYEKRWLAFFTLPLPLLFLLGVVMEIHDRVIGPAIIHEAGVVYVISAYAAIFILILSHLIAASLNKKRAR